MSDSWIRAIVLVCVFGAVILFAESLVRAFVESREHGKAINLRLKLIGQGRTRGEALSPAAPRANSADRAPPAAA